jgi:hypothetical protein
MTSGRHPYQWISRDAAATGIGCVRRPSNSSLMSYLLGPPLGDCQSPFRIIGHAGIIPDLRERSDWSVQPVLARVRLSFDKLRRGGPARQE